MDVKCNSHDSHKKIALEYTEKEMKKESKCFTGRNQLGTKENRETFVSSNYFKYKLIKVSN